MKNFILSAERFKIIFSPKKSSSPFTGAHESKPNPTANFKKILLLQLLLFSFANLFAQVNDGLIAFYPFAGNANDYSGNSNNGTLNSGVSLTADRFGNASNAYLFNGTNGYIYIPNSTSLQLPASTNAITQTAWVYFKGAPDVGPVIMKSDKPDNQFMYRMCFQGLLSLNANYNNWFTGSRATYTFNLNTWYFVATTFDGSNTNFYINGTLVASSYLNVTIASDNLPLIIGADFPGATEYFNGVIDEVRIYDRALTQADIDTLANSIETCNGVDDDGDGLVDETCSSYDNDGDGYSADQGDCDDANADVHPGAAELCNGIDDNCNGTIDEGCDIPSISISDCKLHEGNEETSIAKLFVTLSHASDDTVTVWVRSEDSTATAGSDYQPRKGMLKFMPGQTKKEVWGIIFADYVPEKNEIAKVLLYNPRHATLADSLGLCFIVNDDVYKDSLHKISGMQISVSNSSVVEGNQEITPMKFVVSLSQASADTIKVHVRTVDGAAVAGSDYIANNGLINFMPGQTKKNVWINIVTDTKEEIDETFSLTLFNPVNAGLGNATATGTIINDDHNIDTKQEKAAKSNPESSAVKIKSVASVWPNPASSILNVQVANTQSSIRTITIVNLEGKPMQQWNAGGAQRTMQLNISGIANGLYTVIIRDDKTILHTEKIIIQH